MKNRLVVSAAVLAGLLSLSACAPDPIGEGLSASPSASAGAVAPGVDAIEFLSSVEWKDNGADAAPGLTFEQPVNFAASGAVLVEDGDGEALTAGSNVDLWYVVYSGNDGSTLFSSWEGGAAQTVGLSEGSMEPTLYKALTTSHVGAHLLFAVPDLDGTGASVMAIVVTGVTEVLDRAEGTAVAPVAGLPVVTLGADGAPSVAYDGATMPTALVSQDLIVGAGEPVVEGQSLTVHYTGWVWDGEQFDSSWSSGTPATFTFVTGGLIDGWVQGLTGKTVGSQVLLVIPPELGYGAEGSGSIPGGATLVFVVDILAAS